MRPHLSSSLVLVFLSGACALRGPVAGSASTDVSESSGSTGASTSTGSGSGSAGGPCVGPLGPGLEPDSLPSCGAGAHCVSSIAGWPALMPFAGACDGGGYCVPDALIATGGIHTPKTCTSIGGAAGACLWTAFPEIEKNKAFMPQDVCAPDQRCVPCVSPLDQTETGACELAFECPGSEPDDETTGGGVEPVGGGDDPATCEYDGAPIVDPKTLPACPPSVCSTGGHCIPSAQVPGDMKGQLAACDGASMCVPDPFLIAGSDKVSITSCTSIAGNEGLHVDLLPRHPRAGGLASWRPSGGLRRGRGVRAVLRPRLR
jgi:hypothetical protein